MQQGDYSSAPYYQFPHLQNPNSDPTDPLPISNSNSNSNSFASAPPFAPNYLPPDYADPIPPPTSLSYPNFESHPSYPHQQHQTAPNYASPPSSIPSNLNSNSSYSSLYSTSAPYSYTVPPIPAYDNLVKRDHGASAYFHDSYESFNRAHSDLGYSGVSRYEPYEVSNIEPYGAPKSTLFDDYGRSISVPSPKEPSLSSEIVKAVPKTDAQEDVKTGVQKFRVKLLAETGGQSTMDVLCQVGLDGIRMLDPNTIRTLKIYPLENITRCDRLDSSTFAFWSKSPVDIEPRRIRLQSNSYTTNTLLDTVTAASIQFKEMPGSRRPAELPKTNEQPTEKKKGFGDWMNLIKPASEEKDHWVPDEAVSKCTACGTDFGAFVRKHHCRNCGDIFCDKCTQGRIALTADENAQPVRVCDRCMAEVTQRLNSGRESSSKPVLHSHEDLARKLQEELERNRRTSSGSKSDGSGRRMKEVACPICTVHLQVQVPSSGSETIECGVCQHPFLVSAH